ncbi:MAG: AIR carboxylase family protein [Deltaproteobacteria bacterium]|nr:AIR carboxylase family protein [Deltaproteobacteria bacterium]
MQEKAGVIVSVVMGSDSDLPVMEEAVKVLEAFAVPHELFLTPAAATILMQTFWPGPLTLIFRAAPSVSSRLTGGTGKIGIRVSSHPVATMAIGKAGAKNAALFAIRILTLEDAELLKKLQAYVRKMAQEVERKHENLKR